MAKTKRFNNAFLFHMIMLHTVHTSRCYMKNSSPTQSIIILLAIITIWCQDSHNNYYFIGLIYTSEVMESVIIVWVGYNLDLRYASINHAKIFHQKFT